jgi:hypothetical protein
MDCLQETAFVSAEDDLAIIRQDTAACVSLSNSTMSKTATGLPAPPFSARRRREAAIY